VADIASRAADIPAATIEVIPMWRFKTAASLLLTLVFLASTGSAQVAREVAAEAFPSVVLLVMQDQNHQPIALGSGFFVRTGVVATNVHVIRGPATGYAKLIGQEAKLEIAGVVGLDSAHDLALLSVTGGKAPALPVGDSGAVQVGDEVFAVGNPEGLEGTFSGGIVSGIRNVGSDKLLQITAPISPGSSGGPVLTASGKVVGVAVATFRGGQNLNFAIPSVYLSRLIASPKAPVPLPEAAPDGREESVFSQLGGSNTEGVVGGQLKTSA
jgi:S1-C subfamily serine protease